MSNQTAIATVSDQSESLPATLSTYSGPAVLDPQRFNHMWRLSKSMAASSLIPETLRKDKDGFFSQETIEANCFLVVNQSVRWGMDPFSVISCCSVVHGKLMYEGKLIAAVLQATLGVRLRHVYDDKSGDNLGITVIGRLPGEDFEREISGTVGGWKTTGNNGPWGKVSQHKAQLAYRGTREWARVHEPASMLGVYSEDEMEETRNNARLPAPTPAAPLQLSSDFPEAKVAVKAEAKAKPTATTSAAKAPPPPPTAAKATPEQAKAEPGAEAKADGEPMEDPSSLEDAIAQIQGAETYQQLVGVIDRCLCAPNGAVIASQDLVAGVWRAAALTPYAEVQSSPDGLFQCLLRAATRATLDHFDDFQSWCEEERWFKGGRPEQKKAFKDTMSALRATLPVQGDA